MSEGGPWPPFLHRAGQRQEQRTERKRMAEITFQAAIWLDAESGKFRVQIRFYQPGSKIYVAMMDAKQLGDFIVVTGVDPDVFSTITAQKALVLEGVEVEDSQELAGFGFTQQQGAAK